jgi:hypothetical protein
MARGWINGVTGFHEMMILERASMLTFARRFRRLCICEAPGHAAIRALMSMTGIDA